MGPRAALCLALACVVHAFVAPTSSPSYGRSSAFLTERRRTATVVKTWVDTKVRLWDLDRSLSSTRARLHTRPPTTLTLTHQVGIEVPCDPGKCYELYSQLEEHPRWSPWLRSVVFLDQVCFLKTS